MSGKTKAKKKRKTREMPQKVHLACRTPAHHEENKKVSMRNGKIEKKNMSQAKSELSMQKSNGQTSKVHSILDEALPPPPKKKKKLPKDNERTEKVISYLAAPGRPNVALSRSSLGPARNKKKNSPNNTCGKRCKVNDHYWGQRLAGQTWSLGRDERQEIKKPSSKRDGREKEKET
jgi:hypothetical protein